ncbi:uncharacterized protein LOC110816972 isoform X2 [Carica papaya]|uniref:uncharacterized protein LOC110816972 isoform X2 n=1 Tax=Carica papaya TaxID=3649 RepID=UPI000B8C8035|nr:uncharacterized protein LOC110816972 isoform X2 [Carica papaya]
MLVFWHHYPLPEKISCAYNKPPFLLPSRASPFPSRSKLRLKYSLKYCCFKNEIAETPSKDKGFSVLESDNNPWDNGSVWSTMALYMFYLHIPFGVGGLSIAAYVLHQPAGLDPQSQVLSLLVMQILELAGTLLLLKNTIKPQYKLAHFFRHNISEERNLVLASALGLSFLILLVFLSSLLIDTFIEAKAVNNPIVKEILQSSDIARAACILVYCIITPVLEETVYRGFLLTSLSSTMSWFHAVAISSAIFSGAHFSGENFIQLFIIGCVLGSSYCWTGNLTSSFLIHSLYNALTLLITYYLRY